MVKNYNDIILHFINLELLLPVFLCLHSRAVELHPHRRRALRRRCWRWPELLVTPLAPMLTAKILPINNRKCTPTVCAINSNHDHGIP